MNMTAGNVTVHHNRQARAFEARIGDEVAGVIVYERIGARTVLTHTIVEPPFRGRGVGSALVDGTLQELRSEHVTVTNHCTFVQDYIARHPEYRVVIDTANPGLPLL